jgi:tripartite-type tricarboxylate transporter receptor subunit TctC
MKHDWIVPCALGTAVAVMTTAMAGMAIAQDFPTKPVRVVVGFPPGGSNDIVARTVAPRVGELLGQQVIVENRPGANATIATEYVARATPDGYTVFLGSVSSLGLSPHTYSKLGYDVMRDLAGATTVAMTPELIGVHPSLPVRTMKELIDLAKTQPGKLSFASSGNGGLPHLAIELMKSLAKIDVLHVAYKGAGPAVVDVTGRARHRHHHGLSRGLRAGQGGQDARARAGGRTAPAADARPAHRRRAGPQGADRGELVRHRRPREDAACGRRERSTAPSSRPHNRRTPNPSCAAWVSNR